MSTRFYFPDGVSAAVTPPAGSGTDWSHINASGNIRQKLLTTADSSTLATVAYTPDAADDLTDKNALHRQYVSDPLSAQTLSGNITGQFQILEANANNNLFITLKVLVCSNDGTTTRATLLAVTRETATESATSLTNRTFPSTALSSYTCVAGDRLVVEVGLGGLCTATSGTQGHNGSIRWGCNASSGDLPADETTTATTWRPWIQISNTWTFDNTITPTVGSGTLTEIAGSAIQSAIRAVGVAALALATTAPIVTNVAVFPSTGSLTTQGGMADVRQEGLKLTGQASLLNTGMPGAAGSMALTGAAPTVSVSSGGSNTNITPTIGSLSLTGNAPINDRGIVGSAGSLTLSGTSSLLGYGLNGAAGALTLTGNAPVNNRGIVSSAGSATVSGTSSLLATGLISTVGSLSLTGNSPTISSSASITPAVGSLSLSGKAPTFPGVNTNLTPSAGSAFFGLQQVSNTSLTPITGTAFFGTPNIVTPGSGALTLQGYDQSRSASIQPSTGSIVFTGNVVPSGTFIRPSTAIPLKVSQWDQISWAANTEPDLAGYKVYHGTTSGTYFESRNVNNVTTYVWNDLPYGNNYFVIRAYDTSNNESAPSAEVSFFTSGGGWAPTLSFIVNNTDIASTGSLSLTGQQPSLAVSSSGNTNITPFTGTLQIPGNTPGSTRFPLVASLTLTGAAPTVSVNTNQTITPAGASLTLAGKTPTESWTLTPTSGALAFDQTFKQPVLDHAIFPRTGSLLFLGRVIADLDTAITPSAGTLSASGIIPTQAIRLNTATGSLTLQGYQPATTVPGNVNLIATSGALTITGQSARWNIGVIPSAGSLTLTGTQPAPPNISLTPSAGSLTFNSEASLLFTSPYPCAGRWGTFRWGYRTWCHDIAPQQYTTDDIDLTFHRLSLAVTNTSSTDFVIASITPVFNAMGKRPQHYQAFVDENDLEYVSVGVTQSSRADFVIYDIRPSLNVRKKWRSNT